MRWQFDALVAMDVRRLASNLAGQPPQPGDLPPNQWLGVIGHLCSQIIEECAAFDFEEWVMVSRAVDNALLAGREAGAEERWSTVTRRLNLTAAILQRVPPMNDGSLRDPGIAAEIFLTEASVSVQEAEALSIDWRERDISTVRQLRVLKNMLAPMVFIRPLLEDGIVKADLDTWVQLLPSLP
jgi:hypothetical protein